MNALPEWCDPANGWFLDEKGFPTRILEGKRNESPKPTKWCGPEHLRAKGRKPKPKPKPKREVKVRLNPRMTEAEYKTADAMRFTRARLRTPSDLHALRQITKNPVTE